MTAPGRDAISALDRPSLAALWQAVRTNLERRSLRVEGGKVRLAELRDDELEAVCSLLGRRRPAGSTVYVDLAQLDLALRTGPHAVGLVEVVEALGGPLRDRSGERASAALDRESLWGELRGHPVAADERVRAWLDSLRARGRLTRLGVTAPDEQVAQALDVVAAVLDRRTDSDRPLPPLPLPVLAAELTGDAHALDDDRVVGQVVADAVQTLSGQTSTRRAWATFAVDVDALNSSVLTLGLPGPAGSILDAARRAGEPVRLTSRMVRAPATLAGADDFAGLVVHVCENPSIVAAAADALGPSCAPLVCTDGMPKSVATSLVAVLVERGASVLVHADFDAGGVAIVGHLVGAHSAQPWRFGCGDYLDALTRPTLPLGTQVGATPWDDELSACMNRTGRAVHEESLVDLLLADLHHS